MVLVELRLANAMIITTRPTPIIKTAASPPRIHQTAFDFLGGGALVAGAGVHCGWGGGGGGGAVCRGVTTGGRGVTTGGGG